ncbi:MAG: transpeptidase family protein [Syntrophobacteraceae bacterium]|jgi:cell division protein FtsI (penicillin-binding protein 3)|nr:transpeptidase family protein [Syntrophobacteraceae bacterium]
MKEGKSKNLLNARYWFCNGLFTFIILAGFSMVLIKAFRLQVLEHQVWVERKRAQTETSFQVPAYRGTIYDRQGRILSYSVPQFSLAADSRRVENPRKLGAKLAPILSLPRETLQQRLGSGRRFIMLKRHLSDQQAVAVSSLKASGLTMITEYKRFYPHRQVGGQVVGFVDTDGIGLEGIEKAFDRLLRQDPTTVGRFRDGIRKSLWLDAEPPPEPVESYGVKLSMDAFVQYVAEVELEKCIQQYRARSGEVVVMDARTSEILAMANWPPFDPNLTERRDPDLYRNRAITDYFEPGSTFKVFLVGAALQEGTIRERDRVYCENGRCVLAGHTIRDVHPYGWLSLPDVIKHSSNIAASKLALQLGGERYHRYIKAFGFGELTGIYLPGEVKGQVRPWKKWRPIDLATTGFGQSIGVTALQLTQGIACIANGGQYVTPGIALEIVDAEGQPVKVAEREPGRRVIDKRVAGIVRDMMKGVTQEGGTGVNAAPDGYTVAGKTGTAQMMDPETKRYAVNRYTSLFTGFGPAEDPRIVITIAIREPHGAIYGGVVAAPVFRGIAAKVLPYLGVPPSFKGADPPVQFRLANAASCEVGKPSTRIVRSADPETSSTMPDLAGMSLRQALDRVCSLGYEPRIVGSGRVVGQNPEAGAPLNPDMSVEIILRDGT